MSLNIPAAAVNSKMLLTVLLLAGVTITPLWKAAGIHAATNFRDTVFHCIIEVGHIGVVEKQTAVRWAMNFWQWMEPADGQSRETSNSCES